MLLCRAEGSEIIVTSQAVETSTFAPKNRYELDFLLHSVIIENPQALQRSARHLLCAVTCRSQSEKADSQWLTLESTAVSLPPHDGAKSLATAKQHNNGLSFGHTTEASQSIPLHISESCCCVKPCSSSKEALAPSAPSIGMPTKLRRTNVVGQTAMSARLQLPAKKHQGMLSLGTTRQTCLLPASSANFCPVLNLVRLRAKHLQLPSASCMTLISCKVSLVASCLTFEGASTCPPPIACLSLRYTTVASSSMPSAQDADTSAPSSAVSA